MVIAIKSSKFVSQLYEWLGEWVILFVVYNIKLSVSESVI